MSPSAKILLRTLLKPFFRENGGLILFLLFIMFAAVGHNNGAGLRAYHYSLIEGMLTKTDMLLLVTGAWVLYGLRAASFTLRILRNPEFAFLSTSARLSTGRLYPQLLLFQLIVFLPVLIYAAIILVIAMRLHYYARAAGITAILAGLTAGAAAVYRIFFADPMRVHQGNTRKITLRHNAVPYWYFLLQFLTTQKKTLFLFVKFFSVTMLYAVLLPMSATYEDLRMPILFFSFGPLGHSVLLFQFRDMEEKRLAFYRGMPVSLRKRFYGYAVLYGLVFLPETILLIGMKPGHLSTGNAVLLFGLGYGLLLLLNSILFTGPFTKAGFLKICCGIYLIIFVGVLSGISVLVVAAIPVIAAILFFRSYYRFELSET